MDTVYVWLIKQTTHFCLSAHIIMFEILEMLCIRLKLYAASEALNFDRTALAKLTRKHSTEKILKQSISCASNYPDMHL